jgi:hypothetical protein
MTGAEPGAAVTAPPPSAPTPGDPGPAPAPVSALAGRRGDWLAGATLVLLPLVIYLWALPTGLLNLDDAALYSATLLHNGAWRGLIDVWTDVWFVDYSPVTLVTMWIDLALGDAGNHWYSARIQNPLWLGLGALAAYRCLRRIVGDPRVAYAATLLYVAHPLCANAVLWLAERKNLVAFALSWWCLERYIAWRSSPAGASPAGASPAGRAADSGSGSAGGGRRRVWVPGPRDCAWLLGIAALLAKPHAVAIPVMMAAWEVTLGPDLGGGTGILATVRAALARPASAAALLLRRCAPLLPAVVVVAAYVAIQLHYRSDFADTFLGGSRLAALWCDGWIFASYLGEIVVPRNLTIYYDVVDDPARVAILAACWLAVAATIGATIAVARRRALVLCGWLLAIGAMAPALNLVRQAAPMSDHYIQWGLPGILLAVLVAGQDACARWKIDIQRGHRQLALTGATALLALLSIARIPEYASRDVFFTVAYSKQPGHPMNLAGYVSARVDAYGDPAAHADMKFHRDTGALAIEAVANPHGRILLAFQSTTLIEAGIETWRRTIEPSLAGIRPETPEADRRAIIQSGRAAAWAEITRIGTAADERDFIWARVLIGIGGPDQLAEADQLLSQRLGHEFLTKATEIAGQCRNGDPMPDAIDAKTTIYLLDSGDPFIFRTRRMSLLRLGLALTEARLHEGATLTGDAQRANDDSALGLALLCVNLDPDYAEARNMAAVMYRFIGRDDLATRIVNRAP